MKYLKNVAVAAGFAGICLGGAAIVAANNNNSSARISACVDRDGDLRIIDAQNGKKCKDKERLLTWNQAGPTGPAGPKGSQGSAGAQVVSRIHPGLA